MPQVVSSVSPAKGEILKKARWCDMDDRSGEGELAGANLAQGDIMDVEGGAKIITRRVMRRWLTTDLVTT